MMKSSGSASITRIEAEAAAGDRSHPHDDGHADPAHPALGAARHPRNQFEPRNPAAGSPPRRDAHHPLGRPTDRSAILPRVQPRRAGVLRPQPRVRHPRNRGEGADDRAGREGRRRPRADERRRAGERDGEVRPQGGRHPRCNDHHRERPGHPKRQHDLHRRRGHLRSRRPAPAPWPRWADEEPGATPI